VSITPKVVVRVHANQFNFSHPLPDALAMLMTDGDVPFRVPGPTATFGLRFGQLDRKGRAISS
jgi:hypothetical protein